MLMVWMVLLIPAAPTAWAEDTKLTLCNTQEADGSRFIAERVKQSVKDASLRLEFLGTKGSMNNLKRMAERDCDAAIVQFDALMVYSMEGGVRRLVIAPPLLLFEELLHLICRRGSGFEDVGDMMNEPEGTVVLTGEPGSGSATTWRALSDLDEDLERIATRPLGGRQALEELLAGGPADCMATVVNPKAPFMRDADARGEDLRLVSFDLYELRDAELVENRIYRSAVIPEGTYANLQTGLEDPAVETLGVWATLVIAKAWAKANPKPYATLRKAVTEVKPLLWERMEN